MTRENITNVVVAMGRRVTVGLVAAAVIALSAQPVLADTIKRGIVLSIESGEVYFDIGSDSGLQPEHLVRIWRRIKLRHPVSRKWVKDQLPVLRGIVTMVGESMSMIAPDADADTVRVGDIVEVLIPSSDPIVPPDYPPQPPEEPVAPEPLLPEVPLATRAVLGVWYTTAGSSIDVRIAAWQSYIEEFSDSPHAGAVREDIRILQEIRDTSPTRLLMDEPIISGVEHLPVTWSEPGRSVALAFAVRKPERLLAAWLHYRHSGDDFYQRAELRLDGDGYLRGDVPGEAVRYPGVEYFVEVATRGGKAGAAVATPQQPIQIEVEAPPEAAYFRQRRNRSRVTITSTYLDFATFDSRREGDQHKDVFFLFEVDFLYRLRFKHLHGIRVGFGVINGRGGSANDPESEAAGFNFGYTEFEFRTNPRRAYLARLIAGLGKEGLGYGFEGRIRLGAEEGSNLTFGASSLEEIGWLTEVRMQWGAFPTLPLGFAIAVTDQPNQGDVGVRLSTDVGIKAVSWFQPTLRISYQGRSVQHSGLGVGVGLVFDW